MYTASAFGIQIPVAKISWLVSDPGHSASHWCGAKVQFRNLISRGTFGRLDFKLILEAQSEVNTRYIKCIKLIPNLDVYQKQSTNLRTIFF